MKTDSQRCVPGADRSHNHAYIVGGGIAGLATAVVYLITEAGFPGDHIHVLNQDPVAEEHWMAPDRRTCGG